MLQLANKTPFAASLFLLPNREGIDTVFVVVKATFTLHPTVAVAEKQVPVCLADEYVGKPGHSSLRYASELHIGKPGTDIALVGHARPPASTAEHLMVSLCVADQAHEIEVFGDRTWGYFGPSAPQPFEAMPLLFERAYGGTQVLSETKVLAEERNPVGVGFLGKRRSTELMGTPVPNLEDPRHPLRSPGDRQTPTCFGFVAPSWLPRRAYAGTYDATWQRSRAPYLPSDFDARYFHTAAEGLCFASPLTGGEPCSLLGVSSQGPLTFTLPRCEWRIDIRLAGKVETPPSRLETVLIEPDENRFSLSYRAELACDRRPLQVEQVTVSLQHMEHVTESSRGAA